MMVGVPTQMEARHSLILVDLLGGPAQGLVQKNTI